MDNPEKMMQNCILNVCQPGSSLLASGYCLYSSSTVLVLTIGHGVFGFTYDSQIGEFVLSHPDMKARNHALRKPASCQLCCISTCQCPLGVASGEVADP